MGEQKFVHMTKMPPCPYLVKTVKIIFFRTDWPILLKFGMQHRALEYYKICSNDVSRLTFDAFTQRSTLVENA